MKKQKFKMQVRHWTALASAFLYNLNVFGISARGICSPGFNCHGCKWATFACPVGIAGYGFGIRQIPAFVLGSVIAIGLFSGRLVCAYACPVGLAQEWMHRIPSPKPKLPRFLRYGKYLTLFLLVFGLTWIFGFQPRKGYIKISKPRIDKISEADAAVLKSASVANNEGGAGKDKTYCPVPVGMLGKNGASKMPKLLGKLDRKPNTLNRSVPGAQKVADENGEDKPKASGDKQGKPEPTVLAGSFKPFGLQQSVAVNPQAQSVPAPAGIKPVLKFPGLKPSGIAGADGQNKAVLSQKFPGFGAPVNSASGASGIDEKLLKVELDIENVSTLPVEGFTFTAAYYSNEDRSVIWQDEKPRVFTNTIAPGENLTVPAFVIPYMIDRAELVITSPESNVTLDYWPLFCTYCPVAVVEADIPGEISRSTDWEQMFYATTRMNLPRLLIALAVFVLCIMFSRFFCRVLCPLGAMYAILSKFSLYRIEVHHDKCISCSMIAGSNACTRCDANCPVGLDVFTEAGSPECIACGNCLSACPKGAIVSKFKL